MENEMIEIHWTSGSLDEARKISRYLVQEKWIACAQIIPWIESIYLWNQEIETAQESKIVFKTVKKYYDSIKEVILQNCKYQVPEISWIALDGGNEEYFQWIEESTRKSTTKRES